MADNKQAYRDAVCITGFMKDGGPAWKKVGILTKTKSTGKDVLLLDKSFNPAGCPTNEASESSIAIYFFEPKEKQELEKETPSSVPANVRYPKQKNCNVNNNFDDDIPF